MFAKRRRDVEAMFSRQFIAGAMTVWEDWRHRTWLFTNPVHPALWRHIWVIWEGKRFWVAKYYVAPWHWLRFRSVAE